MSRASDHLFKVGDIWHCWVYYPDPSRPGGKRRQKHSTHCTDKRAAAAFRDARQRAAQDPNCLPEDAPGETLAVALQHLVHFKRAAQKASATVQIYADKAGHIKRLLGDRTLPSLSLEDGISYISKRTDEGASPGELRLEVVTFRQALKVARLRQVPCPDHHAVLPPYSFEYAPKVRRLSWDEFLAVFEKLQPHRQLWLVVAVYTGARRSEIARLRWDAVDLDAGTILVPGKKTRAARKASLIPMPLHPALAFCLSLIPESRRTGLIVGPWGKDARDLTRAVERAKIKLGDADRRISPNDLRRTFASWLKNAGVDSAVVAKMLRHSSTKMVDLVYGVIEQETLRKATLMLPVPTKVSK